MLRWYVEASLMAQNGLRDGAEEEKPGDSPH